MFLLVLRSLRLFRPLLSFLPCVVGVIEVSFHEDSDGYVTLVAYPDCCKKTQPSAGADVCTGNDSSGLGTESGQLDSEQEGTQIASRAKEQQQWYVRWVGGRCWLDHLNL